MKKTKPKKLTSGEFLHSPDVLDLHHEVTLVWVSMKKTTWCIRTLSPDMEMRVFNCPPGQTGLYRELRKKQPDGVFQVLFNGIYSGHKKEEMVNR